MSADVPVASSTLHRKGHQLGIPAALMRGGTSKGLFIASSDLPTDIRTRNEVLRAAMGSPHPLQIDGVGGAHPLSSKVAVVGPSSRPGVALDFLFAQLQPGSETVDTSANCGNMLAAVVPFALETGLLKAGGAQTSARVRTLNTGLEADIEVATPDGIIDYAGDAHIDGAPGYASAIKVGFIETAGSIADSLLPTGQTTDDFTLADGTRLRATCIDNGQPLVIVDSVEFELSGDESSHELESNDRLKSRLEELRLVAGHRMGLGDVTDRPYPKMTIVSPPEGEATIQTRSFIPHRVHSSIGVLAAATVGAACGIPSTVAARVARTRPKPHIATTIEHPTGSFKLDMHFDPDDPFRIVRSDLIRTARLLMVGEVLIPAKIWPEASDVRNIAHPRREEASS